MDEETTIEWAELDTMLRDAVTEGIAEFVTGVRDIDRDWDRYVENLQRLGLDRFLEIYQREYERNYQ